MSLMQLAPSRQATTELSLLDDGSSDQDVGGSESFLQEAAKSDRLDMSEFCLLENEISGIADQIRTLCPEVFDRIGSNIATLPQPRFDRTVKDRWSLLEGHCEARRRLVIELKKVLGYAKRAMHEHAEMPSHDLPTIEDKLQQVPRCADGAMDEHAKMPSHDLLTIQHELKEALKRAHVEIDLAILDTETLEASEHRLLLQMEREEKQTQQALAAERHTPHISRRRHVGPPHRLPYNGKPRHNGKPHHQNGTSQNGHQIPVLAQNAAAINGNGHAKTRSHPITTTRPQGISSFVAERNAKIMNAAQGLNACILQSPNPAVTLACVHGILNAWQSGKYRSLPNGLDNSASAVLERHVIALKRLLLQASRKPAASFNSSKHREILAMVREVIPPPGSLITTPSQPTRSYMPLSAKPQISLRPELQEA